MPTSRPHRPSIPRMPGLRHLLPALRRRLSRCGWRGAVAAGAVTAVVIVACTSAAPRHAPARHGGVERGIASWYGPKFQGRPTASGEIFDMNRLTAAHRTLPFGTRVEVVNLDNGRSVEVTINDRGPWVGKRILDLSYAAARELGMLGPGTARVEIRPLAARGGALYTVQVGAFEDETRAARLREKLRRDYPDTVVRTDGPWHRVQVGEFGDRKAAESLRRKLERLGFTALLVALP